MKTNPTPCVSIKKRLINSAFTKVFTSTTTSSRSFVRNSLIPLLFLLLILPCQAQNQQTTNTTKLYRIAGQIVSETDGAPIPYASITIAFFTDPDTPIQAFATDDKGCFETQIQPGDYMIKASSIGYETALLAPQLTAPGEPVKRFIYKLQEKKEVLDEIVVKPLVSVTSSEIVYNLDQDPDRERMNMHEILDKVPMIDYDASGNLRIGEEGSTFLVVRNGKKDALLGDQQNIDDVLKSLPAKAFSAARISLVPDQRYGSYTYILSIDSDKKNRLFGVVDTPYAEYQMNEGSYTLGNGLLGSHDKVRFNLYTEYIYTDRPPCTETLVQHDYASESTLEQKGRSTMYSNYYRINGAVSYDLSDRHFVTAHVTYKDSKKNERNTLDNNTLQSGVQRAYRSLTERHNQNQWLNGEVNYQYDFRKPGRILNVLYNFKHSPNENDSQTELTGDYTEAEHTPSSLGDQREIQHTVQMHYTEPLHSSLKLETGLSYIYRDYETQTRDFGLDNTELVSNAYRMTSTKQMANAYLNLSYISKRFTGRLHINGEYVNDGKGTCIESGTLPAELISETGLNITPQADFSFIFPDKLISRLSIKYQWKKRRPHLRFLSTNINYSNPNYIQVGNPQLKPEDTHSVTLATQIGDVSFRVFGDYTHQSILPYWYQDEQGRTVSSYANYGKDRSIGIGLNYAALFGKFILTFMGSSSYTYQQIAEKEQIETFYSLLFLNGSYNISPMAQVSLQAGYNARHYTGMNRIHTEPFSLRLQGELKFFDDRLQIQASIHNLIRFKEKYEEEVFMPDFDMRQTQHSGRFPFQLDIRWRLGSFKVKAVRKAHKGAIINDLLTE